MVQQVTERAEEADIFVVPYLAGLDCFLGGHQFRCPTRWNEHTKDLFRLLGSFSISLRHNSMKFLHVSVSQTLNPKP